MSDLKNPNAIYAKGVLFLAIAIFSAVLIVLQTMDWRIAALLLCCIWASCRFYYFAFYVIQHYVDDRFRFSGLLDFAKYLIRRTRQS
jgi:uncharacterized membrane protein